jgi:hypothetical protein
MGHAILRLKISLPMVLLVIGLNLLIILLIFVRPQFTAISILLAVSAIIHLVSLLKQPPEDPKRWIVLWPLAALLFAFLMRYTSVMTVVVVAAPALWGVLKPNRKHVVIAVLLVTVLWTWDKTLYRMDPDWKDYEAYNLARMQFTDLRRPQWIEETQPIFEQVGWSENDYYMMILWFFEHRPTFGLENLQTIIDAFPFIDSIKQNVLTLPTLVVFLENRFSQAIFVMFALCFLLLRSADKGRVLACIASVALVFIVIQLYGRGSTFRVNFPLMAFVVLLASVYFADRMRLLAESVRWQWLMAMLTLGAGLYQVHTLYTGVKAHELLVARAEEEYAAFAKDGQLVITWSNLFPYELLYRPFELGDSVLKDIDIYGLGWGTHTPYAKAKLARFGISDLHEAIYQNSNVYVISRTDFMPLLVQFTREHYDVNTRINHVFDGKTLDAFQLEVVN